jgi:hypothetical protein
MSAADINLAQDLHQVAKVYGVDPDLVLRRRFRRLHYFNLFYKHARLVALDQSVANYESLKQTISTNGPQPAGTVEETPKIAQLLKDIEEALKDFGVFIFSVIDAICSFANKYLKRHGIIDIPAQYQRPRNSTVSIRANQEGY